MCWRHCTECSTGRLHAACGPVSGPLCVVPLCVVHRQCITSSHSTLDTIRRLREDTSHYEGLRETTRDYERLRETTSAFCVEPRAFNSKSRSVRTSLTTELCGVVTCAFRLIKIEREKNEQGIFSGDSLVKMPW